MKAEELIIDNMKSVMTSPCNSEEVVAIAVVKKAIEMAKIETKRKAVEAFVKTFKQRLGECYQVDVVIFNEFLDEQS